MNLRIKRIILWLLSSVTRWAWRLVVFAAIFTAVIVSAGRELAPLLSKHKTWLEANLTASTGEIITMQQVDAYWEGLVPELVVKNLTIGDVLQVDSALMRIDLLGSVRSFALVFDTLDVNRASVSIPVGMLPEEEVFNFRAYLEFIFGSADIRVRNLEITLRHGAENHLLLHVDELTVKNDRRTHWLNGAITVGKENPAEKRDPLHLVIKFDGEADNIFMGQGSAYVDMGDEKNLALAWQFLNQLPDNKAISRLVSMDHVQGRVWASWKNERIEWVSETSINGLAFAVANNTTHTVGFSGRLAGHILTENMLGTEYFVHVTPGQEILIDRRRYPLPVFGVQYTGKDLSTNNGLFGADGGHESLCKIYLPDFNLATLAQYLDLLPSEEMRRILKKLNPSGELINLLVTLPLPNPESQPAQKPLIQARLSKVSVSAWQGAPALTAVDGYLETSIDSGFVELDSREGFSMHYKTLYRQPMKYHSARGRVLWNIEPGDQHIFVGSRDLAFQGDDGQLQGAFWLDIAPVHSRQPSELYLAAGLTNAHVKYRNKYLPYTLKPSIRDWLASAIKDGSMSKSSFIYRGPLDANQANEDTLLFYSEINNGFLQFDPAWPVLGHMNASLLVDNDKVHAYIKNGNFLASKFSNAIVDVKPSINGEAHFLSVQADAAGPGNDILNVIRDTPLKKIFGNVFDGWQLQGETKAHLNLGVHIGSASEPEYQELDLHLKNNDLLVGKIDLPLDQLSGDVHYSSTAGLSSVPLTARLWGQPQLINIAPVNDGDGLPDIALTLTGNIDPQSVATWSHLPFVHFFNGFIPVAGTVSISLDTASAGGPDGSVLIQSGMNGVAIDLPEPFKKTADATVPSTINIDLWKDRQIYRIEYGQLMKALVEQNQQGKLKGDIAINQHYAPATDLPDFLRIRANIDQASLSEWLPVMDRHTTFSKTDALVYKKQRAARNDPLEATENEYPVFDLLIKQLSIGSLILDDMKLLTSYQQDKTAGNFWHVAFENAKLAGRYHYFDDEKRLPEIDFDVVRLGEAEAVNPNAMTEIDDSQRVDPLADVVPQDLPAMRVHAKRVWLDGDDVGDWRYTLNPDKQGVVLNDLYVTLPGLIIKGREKDRGATVHWYRNGNDMTTEVDSNISVSNQDGMKNLFGVERIIEADKTNIQGVVNWKGSPAMLSFRRMQGDLSFASEKGRFLNSTASTDLMRVINVFNFSTWARRLKFDFTDLYKKGVSFDKVSAQINLDQGKVTFQKPLVMEGPSGRFELTGTMDSVRNIIDASLIVTIPVNKNAAWIAALAAGLPVAAGVWAVSKIFGDQIDQLSSVNYSISGTLDEPNVKFVGLLPELSKSAKDKN